MFSFLFLFILFHKSLCSENKCSCRYDFNSGETKCDSNCQQQLVEQDFLYQCPDKRFQQRLPLWKWLLAEMFCIAKDNRDEVAESYQSSSNINYDTPSAFSSSQSSTPSSQSSNSYSYGSSIMISVKNSNLPFSFPTVSLFSSYCER